MKDVKVSKVNGGWEVQVKEAERTQKFHCATEAQATTLSMVLSKVGESSARKGSEQKPST